jgi:ferredoxin
MDGLAKVDYHTCIGCKACSRVCPRNIISMVPFKSERMLVVACSNLDFGKDVKGVCETGCIGCKACSRHTELIQMDGHLPVIDYESYSPEMEFEPVLDKCRMESLFFIGKPTPKDLAALADVEAPDRAMADFETTVDKTDWWG